MGVGIIGQLEGFGRSENGRKRKIYDELGSFYSLKGRRGCSGGAGSFRRVRKLEGQREGEGGRKE